MIKKYNFIYCFFITILLSEFQIYMKMLNKIFCMKGKKWENLIHPCLIPQDTDREGRG